MTEKVHENKLRRAAARRGLTLTKTRTRDPLALDYGRWTLATAEGVALVEQSGENALDAIEAALLDPALLKRS